MGLTHITIDWSLFGITLLLWIFYYVNAKDVDFYQCIFSVARCQQLRNLRLLISVYRS